jgi:hypothetical protein
VYCAGIFEHGNAFLLAIKIVLRGSFGFCCGGAPVLRSLPNFIFGRFEEWCVWFCVCKKEEGTIKNLQTSGVMI